MAIFTKKSIELKDDETHEEVKVSVLANDNYEILINGVSNQLKQDIFEALVRDMQEMVV